MWFNIYIYVVVRLSWKRSFSSKNAFLVFFSKGKLLTQFFLIWRQTFRISRSHLDRSRVHICLRAMGFKIVGNRKEKRTPSWESTRLFLKSRRAEVEGAVNSYARVRRWVLWPMLSALCPILLQKISKKDKAVWILIAHTSALEMTELSNVLITDNLFW